MYAHVPMILGPDGAKLSKRHGAVSVLQYQEEGYLPDALLNYLVRLGWSHGDQEVFTREEMIAAFDIKDVNKAASAFNPEKLLWLNQQHMMRAPRGALVGGLRCAAGGARHRGQRRRVLLEGVVERAARARQDSQGDGPEQPVSSSARSSVRRQGRHEESHGRDAPVLQALEEGFAASSEWNAGPSTGAQRGRDALRRRPGQSCAAAARGGDRAARFRRRSISRWRCWAGRGPVPRIDARSGRWSGSAIVVDKVLGCAYPSRPSSGAIAQLGERLHGMQEVGGSIPPGSTTIALAVRLSPSSRGPGHRPFTAVTGVRIPLGTPVTSMCYKFDVNGIPVSGKAGMTGGAGRRPASLDDRLAYIAHLRRRITRRTVDLAVRSNLFCRNHCCRSGNA